MKKQGFIIAIMLFFLLYSFSFVPVAKAQIPTGQDMGSAGRTAEDEQKASKMREKLTKKKEEPIIKEDGIQPEVPEEKAYTGPKVLIEKIEVQGSTILSPAELASITYPYEGKELSLDDFRQVADEISDAYRQKGYVTTIAYLAPQRIENKTLVITVAEGRVGDIKVSGNKWFDSNLLLGYIDMKKGELFNYDDLREGLNYINESQDRNASVVLERGVDPGQTDVNINVEDKLPLHVTLGYNNHLSRYLERNKGIVEFKCNNFMGLDHIIAGEIQFGEDGRFQLYTGRYLMPIFTPRNKLGIRYIHLDQELGGTVGPLLIKGKGDIISVFWNWRFFQSENLTMTFSPGFEYKDIENESLGTLLSQDRIRIARLGFDLDWTDPWNGRTIITNELDFGIPNLFNGLDYDDPKGSRAGTDAGGQFVKNVTNAARIQALPYDLSFMFRGAMQVSANDLTSTEQFNIGGPTTVRGYPIAEYAGDNGYTIATELYVPPYFLPKEWKVPFTDTSLYDALRLVGFWDWGLVTVRTPLVGETERQLLHSIGPAVRFNIPGRMAITFDYGFALGQKGSDGSRSRGYVEVKVFI